MRWQVARSEAGGQSSDAESSRANVRVQMCVRVHVHVCTCVHVRVCKCACAHVCAYAHCAGSIASARTMFSRTLELSEAISLAFKVR